MEAWSRNVLVAGLFCAGLVLLLGVLPLVTATILLVLNLFSELVGSDYTEPAVIGFLFLIVAFHAAVFVSAWLAFRAYEDQRFNRSVALSCVPILGAVLASIWFALRP